MKPLKSTRCRSAVGSKGISVCCGLVGCLPEKEQVYLEKAEVLTDDLLTKLFELPSPLNYAGSYSVQSAQSSLPQHPRHHALYFVLLNGRANHDWRESSYVRPF
jgi:hypothetical protein